MYHNIFDTHSHYDDSKFNPDREDLLDNLQSQGVSLVVSCGCDIDSTQFNFDLAQKYDYIYFAAGLHPENLKGANLDDLKIIEKFAKNKNALQSVKSDLIITGWNRARMSKKSFSKLKLNLQKSLICR